jgi:phage repressor protein C with HTH and peptisase S24 domain/DNA-binding transcriptional regulator YiaG
MQKSPTTRGEPVVYQQRITLINSSIVRSEEESARKELHRVRGRRIKSIREKRGMTQAQLAQAVGITKDAISRIERGVNGTPRLDEIAAALQVDIMEIFRPEVRKFVGAEMPPDEPDWLREDQRIADATLPRDEQFIPFEIPPEEYEVGDYDYMQTFRGGPAEIAGAWAAGPFADFDTSGEFAEVLNPTLRDIRSGRYGVVKVQGDSMSPRLKSGDLVLVDTYDKELRPNRIMAVYHRITPEERRLGKKGGSAFGYLHKVGNSLILTKANPAHPPIILTDRDIIRGVVKKRLAEDLDE